MSCEWSEQQQTIILSHSDVSESVTEGHYTGTKMGDHKKVGIPTTV